jgi:pimeloyl-ACP methyl ester carboxylesterase
MKYDMAVRFVLLSIIVCVIAPLTQSTIADDGEQLVAIDHYVSVRSVVPSMAGQIAQIYVRERFRPSAVLGAASLTDRVVLFVHGAGTPAEVSFDVPYQDYSWMTYLAQPGFDVFAMDTTGYGRSTRPTAMNDPCNLSREQQATFIPKLLPAPCAPTYPHQMTTIASDWNDIDAVVHYIRALRHVDRVSIIAWSLGGPATAPPQLPADGPAMNTQSHQEFTANWDRQVGCQDQYDPAASESVWSEMIKSDPVGATWGAGVRRAPQVTTWGWNAQMVAKTQIPILMITGEHDKQVPSERVRELYADLASRQKVFIDLACSSHNAMWERNHLLLFRASLEWLTRRSINGKQDGMVRLGYEVAKELQ